MASTALSKGALWMQNVDYPASWDRSLIDVFYATEGVLDGFVVSANGGLGLSISAGRAVVQGDEVANQGKYLVDQDSAVTLTLASVGSTRTEYVYIAINDPAVAGGRAGDNVTIDTSTSPPPDSALLLATLTLPGGTSTITSGMIADSRVSTSVVAPSSVVTSMIADSAVTTAKIADGTIVTVDLADSAVTTAKIADATIVAGDLADSAVTTAKIADAAITQAKLSAELAAVIDAIDPADAIIMVAGATAPTGWALCDGSAVSRSTYAATFARISTTYGVGNGSTTFNLPDYRNRFVACKGGGAAWSDTLAETGGSKDAVAVAHTHGHADHGHGHTITASSSQGTHAHVEGAESGAGWLYSGAYNGVRFDVFVGSGLSGARSTYGYAQPSTGQASAGAITTSISGGVSNGNAGTTNSQTPTAAATDNRLPPYIVANYCIRLR